MNLLSDAALRDLRRMKIDLNTLRNDVKRLGISGPRGSVQKYARVTASIDPGKYEADEVVFAGGATAWTEITDGRTWGEDTGDIGPLYSIDYLGEDAPTGVYPVYRFSDGDSVFWGFVPSTRTILDSISGHIENPSAKTYTLELSLPTDGTILRVQTGSGSGTADLNVLIHTTEVNFEDNGGETTDIDFAPEGAIFEVVVEVPNTGDFLQGQTMKITLSNVSGLTDAVFTVNMVRSVS